MANQSWTLKTDLGLLLKQIQQTKSMRLFPPKRLHKKKNNRSSKGGTYKVRNTSVPIIKESKENEQKRKNQAHHHGCCNKVNSVWRIALYLLAIVENEETKRLKQFCSGSGGGSLQFLFTLLI